MNEFLIGNFRVDVDRCQVHCGQEVTPLEPKVLQVLLFLARRQGEVVSHQELLDAVWTGTVVDPSALQRCIAQLRKAFRDNAKTQQFIATFPKKGYCLLPEVKWQAPRQKRRSSSLWYALALASFVLSVLLGARWLTPLSGQQHITAPIATLEEEALQDPSAGWISVPDFYAAYSPDGHFVVYPRFSLGRFGHLWARDLSDGREYLLTEEAGYYEYAAWSPDSSQIAFVQSACRDEQCLDRSCSSLKLLSLPLPRNRPPKSRSLSQCTPVRIQAPEWLSNHELALVEQEGGKAWVSKLELENFEREILFQEAGKQPFHLAYSSERQQLAVTVRNRENGQQLLLIAPQSGELRRFELPELPSLEPWYPSWNHQASSLLISTPSGEFNISLDGRVSLQSFPYIPSQPSNN